MTRFLFAGALSTLLDYGVFAALVVLGAAYPLAITIGYLCGFAFNFIVVRWLVFGAPRVSGIFQEFALIAAIAAGGLSLNIFIVYVLHEASGLLGLYWARVVAVAVVLLYNYSARKRFVYHPLEKTECRKKNSVCR